MRRYRVARTATGVSLFPFLAVLICTMGALIVLLVMVIQQARVHATTVAERKQDQPTPEQEALRQQQADYQWRWDVLEQQRGELLKQLNDHRLELAHLEDHIRRLTERWKLLKQQAEALQQADQTDEQQLAQQAELQQLQAEIQRAQESLEEAKRNAASRQPSFAIIPYKGAQGTHRRPIYIECTGDSITLRPENIVLRAEDFAGPLGPGNPLDAALRAVREYWAAQGQTQWQGEPYPLLIVRPEGATSYAVARSAMKTWDDEFGYELVDADLELAFPPADPALAHLIERAVADARQREAMLAAAMPSRYRGRGTGPFRATARGGFAPVNAPGSAPSLNWGGEHSDTSATGYARSAGGASDHAAESNSPPMAAEAEQSDEARSGPGGPQEQPGFVGSLADQRGQDWALPKSAAGRTGITRPIRVACFTDRLVILPEKGDMRAPETIMIDAALPQVVDRFVGQTWKHIDAWGIAVAGGYWKPVLQVEVAPEAEQRFYEFQRQMDGSGIAVERRSP